MGYKELYDRHLHRVGTRNGPWPNLLDRVKKEQRRRTRLYDSGTITEGEMTNQFLDICEFYADCCAEAGFDIARVQDLVDLLPNELRQALHDRVARSPRTQEEWRNSFDIFGGVIHSVGLTEQEWQQKMEEDEERRKRLRMPLFAEFRRILGIS